REPGGRPVGTTPAEPVTGRPFPQASLFDTLETGGRGAVAAQDVLDP
ncbi:MAG: hypothetical protein QOG97_3384, partial [Acidimicrobiaceae bacterium]|nr:hypothetical protein [Acidimicrobiaceae bacterium]